MRHRFMYFIASRMLAVHAACKSPSSVPSRNIAVYLVILPLCRVWPQLTSEEDFSKKPKRRVVIIKILTVKKRKISYYYNFSLADQIFLHIPVTKKENLGTPTVLPCFIGMQLVKHGPVVCFNHELMEVYMSCQLGRSSLREICLKLWWELVWTLLSRGFELWVENLKLSSERSVWVPLLWILRVQIKV